jgi:hypothetical protein
MRRSRTIITAAALFGAMIGGSATAEPGATLAAAGPCAEPRIEARGDPSQPFDVAGGPRQHFDPKDVAASADPGFSPPESPVFARRPCDAPDAACRGGPVPVSGSTVITSPPPDILPGDPFPGR